MIRRLTVLLVALGLLLTGPAPAQQSDSAAVRAAFDSVVTANTYTAIPDLQSSTPLKPVPKQQ